MSVVRLLGRPIARRENSCDGPGAEPCNLIGPRSNRLSPQYRIQSVRYKALLTSAFRFVRARRVFQQDLSIDGRRV